MRLHHLAPCAFLLILSACASKAEPAFSPPVAPLKADDEAYRLFEEAGRELAAQACTEARCPLPPYPASRALLAALRKTIDAAARFGTVSPAVSEADARVTDAWNSVRALRDHGTRLESAVKKAEGELEALEPHLKTLREKLAQLRERAAALGCEVPEDGPGLRCPQLDPEIRSVEEARRHVLKRELAEDLLETSLLLSQAYAAAPEVENEERALARKRAGEGTVPGPTALREPGVNERLQSFVCSKWRAALAPFEEASVPAGLAPEASAEFRDESDVELLRLTADYSEDAESFGRALRSAQPDLNRRAVDHVEIVHGPSRVFGAEAFAFHPSHPSALVLRLSRQATASELGGIFAGLPLKSDPAFSERRRLIERWDHLLAGPLSQASAESDGVSVQLRVSRGFLEELVKRRPLKQAIALVEDLKGVEAAFTRELGYARQQGRAWAAELQAGARLLICDPETCAAEPANPHEARLRLSLEQPNLSRTQLYGAARELLEKAR